MFRVYQREKFFVSDNECTYILIFMAIKISLQIILFRHFSRRPTVVNHFDNKVHISITIKTHIFFSLIYRLAPEFTMVQFIIILYEQYTERTNLILLHSFCI